MKFKKTFLSVIFVAIIFIIAVNASYAVSNEVIEPYKDYSADIYQKKIISVEDIHKSVIKGEKYYNTNILKIDVKSLYQKNYKIKSIKMKFSNGKTLNYNLSKFKKRSKINVKINLGNKYLDKITVNYNTKGKIKNETVNFGSNSKWKGTTYFKGKKSKIVLKESGVPVNEGQGYIKITNRHFKIKTIGSKYYLKSITAYFIHIEVTMVKTFNGHGMHTLTKYIPKTHAPSIGAFKVFYY
ncbi:hypothetical protein [Methanobrevibacter curvatus]|uniref:Uncharacterized protein n=1 Tax=Methanobrevibacter curvatus TaxID=49547 RepID=A0A165Z0P1_9EURY|nr:hypothetical protein [Methanobrevibacter curvatus]KZX10099.1 hypothetical protein MBCUR_19250 [Methanobrevibacter curvatus]